MEIHDDRFHYIVEDFVKIFMDEFLVFGESFDRCLENLDNVLARCEETNLGLKWEKISSEGRDCIGTYDVKDRVGT